MARDLPDKGPAEAEDRGAPSRLPGAARLRRNPEDERLALARRRAAAARQEAAKADRRAARAEQRAEEAERARRRAEEQYARLMRRRTVRLALALSRLAGLGRRAGRGRREAVPSVTGGPSRAEVITAMRAAGRVNLPTRGPLVSVVVLTRDGAQHLRRLFPALDATAYRSFEVLVVDNGSTDDTGRVLEARWSFPLRWIRNEHNAGFSEGNTQAIRESRGDLVLLLNNDVEPLTPDWLGAMVAEFSRDPAPSAVGAVLLFPPIGVPERDLTVQDSRVEFFLRQGVPDVRYGRGDSTDPALYATRSVPAVTGAVCLMRRATFEAVGGFSPGYFYGYEDTDLCLKLQQLGALMVAGQAVLLHHVSRTFARWEEARWLANSLAVRRRFTETWAPRLARSVRRDTLVGRGWWTGDSGGTAAITLTVDREAEGKGDYYVAHGLGAALAAAGWEVIFAEQADDGWYELPDRVGLVVALLDGYDVRRAPKGALTVAWVHNRVEQWLARPWLDGFDLVVAASHRSADVIGEATGHRPPVLPLAADPGLFRPGPVSEVFAADYAFTGSFWGARRRAVEWQEVGPRESFIIAGKNWDQDGRVQRYWRGHLPQGLLAELYRSVKVVLDDSATPLDQALLNGRVFEALAAGALVISDNVEGSREVFGGLLPTYRDREELRARLDRYLSDEEGRRGLTQQLRRAVLEEHTYARRVEQIRELALAVNDRPRLSVKVAARGPAGDGWGDWQVAWSLARELRPPGFWSGVDPLDQWDDLARQAVDVVLHLRGPARYRPKPAHVNVLWIVGEGLGATADECGEYDLVLCASQPKVEALRQEGVPAVFLALGADARRFGTARAEERLRTGLLFVGNCRDDLPASVRGAVERGLPLTVLGSGWGDRLPAGVVASARVPARQVGAWYASAGAVLIDDPPDAADWGLVPAQVFDVLAAGGVAVSAPNSGLDSILPGLVPTFASADELGRLAGELVPGGERRSTLVEQGRSLVLAEHTMAARAARVARLVWALLEGRPCDCEGGSFGAGPREEDRAAGE